MSRSEDTSQFAFEALRRNILVGDLPPGAVLSQVQLAGQLGISRTPLRAALGRLAAEGLINGDFNRRVRVSELDLNDFDQIYAMRIALEPIAYAATVPSLSSRDLARLSEAVTQMDTLIDTDDREAFREVHRVFHLGLIAGAGERMRTTLAELWDHSERYRLRYLHPDGADDQAVFVRMQRAQAEHREILDAASERDVGRCVRAQLDHMQRTLEAVLREAAPPPRPRLAMLAAQAL